MELNSLTISFIVIASLLVILIVLAIVSFVTYFKEQENKKRKRKNKKKDHHHHHHHKSCDGCSNDTMCYEALCNEKLGCCARCNKVTKQCEAGSLTQRGCTYESEKKIEKIDQLLCKNCSEATSTPKDPNSLIQPFEEAYQTQVQRTTNISQFHFGETTSGNETSPNSNSSNNVSSSGDIPTTTSNENQNNTSTSNETMNTPKPLPTKNVYQNPGSKNNKKNTKTTTTTTETNKTPDSESDPNPDTDPDNTNNVPSDDNNINNNDDDNNKPYSWHHRIQKHNYLNNHIPCLYTKDNDLFYYESQPFFGDEWCKQSLCGQHKKQTDCCAQCLPNGYCKQGILDKSNGDSLTNCNTSDSHKDPNNNNNNSTCDENKCTSQLCSSSNRFTKLNFPKQNILNQFYYNNVHTTPGCCGVCNETTNECNSGFMTENGCQVN